MGKEEALKTINQNMTNTLMETLGIKFIDIGDGFVTAKMPVNSKVHQPAGLLHGGASVALAESVGSVAAHLMIDQKEFEVRGLEITANHLKSVKKGVITATAKAIHKGKTTQLWEIKIVNENGDLVSYCKLTTIVLKKGRA